jgi:hypothetical protein
MTGIIKTDLFQDWTEQKPIVQLQQLFQRLVAKFDYAHPESEQNKRKLEPVETRIKAEEEIKPKESWLKERDELPIEKELPQDETQKQEVELKDVDEAIEDVYLDLPSSKEDKSTLTYLVEQGAQILSALKLSATEENRAIAEEKTLPTMDTERESIVDVALKWEKEHGMQPPEEQERL